MYEQGTINRNSLFPGVPAATLYDAVTSMFLDCGNDGDIAAALSREYRSEIELSTVRTLRVEAAMAADKSHSPELKRKWIFRYNPVTINSLVKEYMFLEGKASLLQAKVDLAHELHSLSLAHEEARLWLAVNEALGRNNIPLNLIKTFVAYWQTHEKLSNLIKANDHQASRNAPNTIKNIAAKISHAFDTTCGKDRNKTANYACHLLSTEQGTLGVDAVEFLRDYHTTAAMPDRPGSDAFLTLLGTTDNVVQRRSALDKAIKGNTSNLSPADLNASVREMRARPILKADVLKHILESARKRSLRADAYADSFRKFAETVSDILSLTDARRFLSAMERMTFRLLGLAETEVNEILSDLNALSDYPSVASRLDQIVAEASSRSRAVSMAQRYCSRRFHRQYQDVGL